MITAGVRNQLNILRQNQDMTARVSERVSTGLRINSSADGAYEYSVANKLRERAQNIDYTLSSITQVKTGVKAASTTLSSISTLLSQAKSIVETASSGTLTDAERAAYGEQFNDILESIDKLVPNANISGANLISGETDDVTTENGQVITVGGETVSAADLGLTDASLVDADGVGADGPGWGDAVQGLENVAASLDQVEAAIASVQTMQSSFDNQEFILNVHESFAQTMQELYLDNAVTLTAADQNEEAANLQALRTQAQLASSSISILNQSQSTILQLFS